MARDDRHPVSLEIQEHYARNFHFGGSDQGVRGSVLEEASSQSPFSEDPYVIQRRPGRCSACPFGPRRVVNAG
jgi:hypothetical protein